jgi:chromosome segregation ATPase
MTSVTGHVARTFLIGLLLVQPLAHAEDKQAARSQEQLRRLRQQVQQLQQAQQAQQQSEQKILQEKSAADEQLKQRNNELNTTGRKLKDSTRQLADLETRVKTIEQERDALSAKLGDSTKRLAELEGVQRDTATKLRTRDGEALGLQASLTAELAERKRCEANNIALYQYGRELMALYENKGVVSALRHNEPVFGLGQVQMQNMLEEYRDKLDAQKRQALVGEPSASTSATAAGKP